jgi:hypothetical protein
MRVSSIAASLPSTTSSSLMAPRDWSWKRDPYLFIDLVNACLDCHFVVKYAWTVAHVLSPSALSSQSTMVFCEDAAAPHHQHGYMHLFGVVVAVNLALFERACEVVNALEVRRDVCGGVPQSCVALVFVCCLVKGSHLHCRFVAEVLDHCFGGG